MAHRLGASAAENRAVPLGRGDAFIATNISEADCDVTQKGYEKKRAKLLAPYVPQTRENSPAPPDVTYPSSSSSDRTSHMDLPSSSGLVKGMTRDSSKSSIMDTADGVPVNSRVSTKIQQLLNTLKRPKRPPLKEFFMDDFEEIVEVPQPDPNQPKPEGRQIVPVKGEPLGVGSNWPPSLEAALQRWGTTQAKCPCLTALDVTGKTLYTLTYADPFWDGTGDHTIDCVLCCWFFKQPGSALDVTGKTLYTLTYGKLWSRSLKLAYTLLNKLGTKNEPVLKPGDRVALVYPNSDPGMFLVAFYGCLLAEVIPVPIEVPLSRKDAGGQQIGFLLGSCGVALALTSEVCLKGLPKTQNGEIVQFKGWPRLKWVVTDSKYLTKPSKDWQPHIADANTDPAYIECWALTPGLCCLCDSVLGSNPGPGVPGAPLPARAILSMSGLSFGVIRVNTEDKNSALTVQDGSLVFVVGKMDGLLMVSGRRHNADDIVATALAVEPVKTVYRGRIAVFSVTVFYDERIVVVAEQRPDASEEDSFQWMSRVLQAIDSIHQVGLYCLALVPANTLPKTPLGGIHLSQSKQYFLEGGLHPCNILMCPHTCVTNLPKPRQKQPGTKKKNKSIRSPVHCIVLINHRDGNETPVA
ncbi:UNVERIFIED_CONTAM: hypothetical protein FKN15_073571 [Acipenser sinensis]